MVAALIMSACGAPAATPAAPTIAPATSPAFVPTPSPAPLPEGAEPLDLTGLAAAWTAGDIATIRSFYTDDAVVATPSDLVARENGGGSSLAVADAAFADRVAGQSGQVMRIVGQPLRIHDKLGLFFFRLQGSNEGRDGAAILRFEGSDIFMHVYVLAESPTPNDSAAESVAVDLSDLLTWQGGAAAVLSAYVEDATILNDEDVVGIAADPAYRPNPIASEIAQMASMDPAVVGPAQQVRERALAVWRLRAMDPPVGYGVRLLTFSSGLVGTDVRFVIRPWESSGATFLSGY